MPRTGTEIMQSNHAHSELKKFGAQCLYSFVFSAFTAFVLCALTPAKVVDNPATQPGTQPALQ